MYRKAEMPPMRGQLDRSDRKISKPLQNEYVNTLPMERGSYNNINTR